MVLIILDGESGVWEGEFAKRAALATWLPENEALRAKTSLTDPMCQRKARQNRIKPLRRHPMLKSLTIAIALLAAPVATSFAGFDSTAYAATAGGGANGGGGGGGGGGGIGGSDGGASASHAAALVPNNEYKRSPGITGAGCPTPTEGRYGPKRFIGSCGPY
jgi:hypothetical protein